MQMLKCEKCLFEESAHDDRKFKVVYYKDSPLSKKDFLAVNCPRCGAFFFIPPFDRLGKNDSNGENNKQSDKVMSHINKKRPDKDDNLNKQFPNLGGGAEVTSKEDCSLSELESLILKYKYLVDYCLSKNRNVGGASPSDYLYDECNSSCSGDKSEVEASQLNKKEGAENKVYRVKSCASEDIIVIPLYDLAHDCLQERDSDEDKPEYVEGFRNGVFALVDKIERYFR